MQTPPTRDCGLGGVLRQPQQIGIVYIGPREVHREGRAAVLQIGTGAKRFFASAGQHDHPHVLVVMGVAIAAGDAGDDVAIQRIALVGPVDGDPVRLPALFADYA